MMESLHIDNFKNLKSLRIDRLSRVNLIVGKNNVGKSTLLEAISIYLANASEEHLRKLLANRGEDIVTSSDIDAKTVKAHYLSLFNGRKEIYTRFDNSIIIGDGKFGTYIQQVYIGETTEIDDDGKRRQLVKIMYEDDMPKDLSAFTYISSGLWIATPKYEFLIRYDNHQVPTTIVKDRCPFQYVHTIDFNTDDNAILFDRVAMTPEEKYIIQALNIINPNIEKLNFLNSDDIKGRRIPLVSIGDKRYRLSSMGDGINRILTIILALLNCKDGVLLLDEFETGLHYSVQDQLWEIIFMLSEKLNVQVFVTTHSNDCVSSFARTNKQGVGQLIRLVNHNGDIVPTILDDIEELRFASDNSVEMR